MEPTEKQEALPVEGVERVNLFRCTCNVLHLTKAKATFCLENKHLSMILDGPPEQRTNPYGEPVAAAKWSRVNSEVGTVLVFEYKEFAGA